MTAELAVTFECEGTPLIGVLHIPHSPRNRGVLAIVAGGPQYRAGCCRQLVEMARSLASSGTPVMRFDQRGLGDSQGPYPGFQNIAADIAAAIATFRRHVPGLDEVILWGGCDAASAAMIHGWQFPEVRGMILSNPFVHSEQTHAKVLLKRYYLQRLREKTFWMKFLRFRFNPIPALQTLGSVIRDRLGPGSPSRQPASAIQGDARPKNFIAAMRDGMSRFHGHVLLLMSGRSLVSKEFDELLAADPTWRAAMAASKSVSRHDIPEADQTFSSVAARQEALQVTKDWLSKWNDTT